MVKSLFIITLALIGFLSCNGKGNKQSTTHKQFIIDTIDYHLGRKMRVYGNDSIHWFYGDDKMVLRTKYIKDTTTVGNVIFRHWGYDGELTKETYIVDSTQGMIHSKSFYPTGELYSIAYVKDTLLVDATKIDWSIDCMRSDFVKVYSKEGKLESEGYEIYYYNSLHQQGKGNDIDVWTSYDSLGRISKIVTPTRKSNGDNETIAYDYYHPNGQLESRAIQGYLYGGVFTLEYVSYDSSGYKLSESTAEYKYPKDGVNYNSTFGIHTTKEFYPNGKLKLLSKTKSYPESEQCPCGKWTYYDKNGNVTKTEKYPNCYNFELECTD